MGAHSRAVKGRRGVGDVWLNSRIMAVTRWVYSRGWLV